MIEWKLITSDDELPKETILVGNSASFDYVWRSDNKWFAEDSCCTIREITFPSKEFTHWSETNLPE